MTLGSAFGRTGHRRSAWTLALAALLSCTGTAALGSTVVYVDDDAPGGDGSSWANALRFLQDGLAAAAPGSGVTEIRVGPGEYRPDRDAANQGGTGERSATFQMIGDVTIAGGYAGYGAPDPDLRDIATFETVLSGDLLGDDDDEQGTNVENSHHVVRADGLVTRARLDGVTVCAGNSQGSSFTNGAGLRIAHSPVDVVDCRFVDNFVNESNGSGGAISAGGGPTTIMRCTFVRNGGSTQFTTAAGGGAVWIIDTVTVVDCIFTENIAYNGGAVFVTGDAEIRGSVFEANVAEYGGAVFRRELGGQSNDLLVVESTFRRNTAGADGGALHFESGDVAPGVLNSSFIENTAGVRGGAISRLAPGASVSACLFAGNTAQIGGAVATRHPGIEVMSCTFAGNVATSKGGGLHQIDNNPPQLINSVFWGNADAGGMDESGQISRETAGYDPPSVDYCVVHGLTGEFGGNGNIGDDPLFTDADGPDNDPETFDDNDYRPSSLSTCIDAGHNWGEMSDVADLDGDGDTVECAPLDSGGAARFTDSATTEDTGCGAPVVVDIGAFEFAGDGVNPILPGDIDGSGAINFSDLLEVLAAWGPDPAACLTDVNRDGVVNFSDILVLLANWE